MKQLTSLFLCFIILFTLSMPAFAVEMVSTTTTRSGIIGEIFYEETDLSVEKATTNSATSVLTTTLSGTVNDDGSVSTYQYENNRLIEYHTTIPGSPLSNNDGLAFRTPIIFFALHPIKHNATIAFDSFIVEKHSFDLNSFW